MVIRAIVLLAMLAGAAGARAAGPSPDDFAQGWRLQLPGGGGPGVYRLRLAAPVYRQLRDAGLADWMIFDAGGRPVPVLAAPPGAPGWRPAPVFPLPQARGDPDDMRVSVERGPDGRVLRVRTDVTGDPRPGRERAYLVDLSAMGAAVTGLRLSWRGSGDFLAALRVAASDNLSSWRVLIEGQSVGELAAGADRLVRQSVNLPATRAAYLRLRLDDVPAGRQLVGVELELAGAGGEGLRRWTEAKALDAGGRTLDGPLFDSGGPFPVDRVAAVPLAPPSAATARVFSADSLAGPWRSRGRLESLSITPHDAAGGQEGLDIPAVRDRYWRLEVQPAGEPLGLRLGWLPDEYLFIASGDGPYTLAAGSARVRRPDRDLDDDRLRALPLAGAVTLGAGRELGGAAALERPANIPWTRVGLWTVLAFGVGVVVVLAVRLVRDTRDR